MANSVTPQDLEKYLRTVANKVLADNPEFSQQPDLINKVITDTTQLIRYKEEKSKTPVTKNNLLDPEFMRKLMQTMITQAVLQGSMEQQQFMKELLAALQQLNTSKAYDNEVRAVMQEQQALLNDLNDLLNDLDTFMNLDPESQDKIRNALNKKLQKRMYRKLLKRLEKLLAMRINPNNKEALRDLLRKLINEIKANIENLKKNKNLDKTVRPIKEDVYLNLFGLLNSYITGSIPVPITMYLGNGMGFNDWNPNHGYANIDKINSLNFMFGDSLGVEAEMLRNFFAIEDDVVNELTDLLRAEGLTMEHTAPTPFDTKNNPNK